MRAAISCALALLVAGTLHIASSAAAAANQPGDHKRPKPSSLAPQPGAHSRVYGAPIQPRILKSRPKKKPQLTSSPLPE
jgi:hypothetical protein